MMDGETAAISMENVPPPPLLKLRTDIFKVEVVPGSDDEEKEEGEVDTSLSSVASEEFPTESAISSFVLKLRTEADQSPSPPMEGKTASISHSHLPLLKLPPDIVPGSAEEEKKEEGEVDTDTSLSSTEKSPKRNFVKKRKLENNVLFLSLSIEEKRMKIALLEGEITADLLEIERINKLKISRQRTELTQNQKRFCELCTVTVYTDKTWQSHLKGKRHRKRELEEREIVVLER